MFKPLVAAVLFALSISFAGAADFQLSTHVLDTTQGKPGAGINVTLERQDPDGAWVKVGDETTGKDGRIANFLKVEKDKSSKGTYRFTFFLEKYFSTRGLETVFPEAVIVFKISDDDQHYHIPLVMTPYALSTYQGS